MLTFEPNRDKERENGDEGREGERERRESAWVRLHFPFKDLTGDSKDCPVGLNFLKVAPPSSINHPEKQYLPYRYLKEFIIAPHGLPTVNFGFQRSFPVP